MKSVPKIKSEASTTLSSNTSAAGAAHHQLDSSNSRAGHNSSARTHNDGDHDDGTSARNHHANGRRHHRAHLSTDRRPTTTEGTVPVTPGTTVPATPLPGPPHANHDCVEPPSWPPTPTVASTRPLPNATGPSPPVQPIHRPGCFAKHRPRTPRPLTHINTAACCAATNTHCLLSSPPKYSPGGSPYSTLTYIALLSLQYLDRATDPQNEILKPHWVPPQ